MTQHFVERAIRAVGKGLYRLGYVGVGCVYVAFMFPITVVSAVTVILATQTPNLLQRFDPLFDIWSEHMIMVLDEPIILCSYRLNELFGKFDEKILEKCQLRWYLYTLQKFHQHLEAFKGPNDDYELSTYEHADLMRLSRYLSTVSDTPEKIPEAIGFMHDWMESHPLLSDPEHTA
jgi:hypothetical protein